MLLNTLTKVKIQNSSTYLMASVHEVMDILNKTISIFEKSLPFLVTPSQFHFAIDGIDKAADMIKELDFDEKFNSLSTILKILNNGESSLLSTVVYQGFILDILEELTKVRIQANDGGPMSAPGLDEILHSGEFLVRLAGRITNRYKLRITFEPEYEAKGIRAFMVVKELQPFCRFLSLSPDITSNQNPNLDAGLEVDILSQEPAKELHKLAGSVLEVVNVQIFTETRNSAMMILDPPSLQGSFDQQVINFLEN